MADVHCRAAVGSWHPCAPTGTPRIWSAVVDAGGCAAAMHSLAEWAAHPQGRAVASEPVLHVAETDAGPVPGSEVSATRPLEGIRVLDLTRILAGPVATRFLAGFGADVLRVDPPGWDEPGVVPEVTLGKRCARLDLRDAAQLRQLEQLLAGADVLVDSLVQMSSGIADAGMQRLQRDRPTPLPVQALDHATGYVLAAAAIRGLTMRLTTGRGWQVRTSLARTAALLVGGPPASDGGGVAPLTENEDDLASAVEATPWGPAHRLKPPVSVGEACMHWERPAATLGSAPARW